MNKLEALYEAQRRINLAITAAKALEWLNQYGPTIDDVDSGTCRIDIDPLKGSQVGGAVDAAIYLRRAMRNMLPEIVETATANARQDAEGAKGDLS